VSGSTRGPQSSAMSAAPSTHSFTAIGDTTNLASRLQTVAHPGQVVIGARTQADLGDSAVAQELAPLSVKGKSRPVQAFLLIEAR
jgi:class 3 adenylate cyclase